MLFVFPEWSNVVVPWSHQARHRAVPRNDPGSIVMDRFQWPSTSAMVDRWSATNSAGRSDMIFTHQTWRTGHDGAREYIETCIDCIDCIDSCVEQGRAMGTESHGLRIAWKLFDPRVSQDNVRTKWPKSAAEFPEGYGVAAPPGFCGRNCNCSWQQT